MVKFEGWRAAVRAKFRIVGGCMCVCLLDWWMSSAPGLWLGLPGEPFLPSPLSTPPRVVRSRAPCNGGREGNEEKERERAEWKRRGESEWLGERERSIFETPVPLGTELLSPPHAQWRSKGGAIGLRTTTLPVPRILDERKFGTKRRSVINWPRRDSGITRSCRLPYPSLFFLLCINFHRIPEFNNTSISKFSYSLMRRIIRYEYRVIFLSLPFECFWILGLRLNLRFEKFPPPRHSIGGNDRIECSTLLSSYACYLPLDYHPLIFFRLSPT